MPFLIQNANLLIILVIVPVGVILGKKLLHPDTIDSVRRHSWPSDAPHHPHIRPSQRPNKQKD